mmetsp:Transcript_8516/g.8628  ORF Transcript_8516/g.8628 Transcript_8516/m.8628 type:complete len:438 (+) Transcript_8516:119-1432(+)
MSELYVVWDPYTVLLSYGISLIGSYAAVSLCEQYRLSAISPFRDHKYAIPPTLILIIMAASIGGIAVWCMHFVGMGAIHHKTSSKIEIEIKYDIGLTISSVIVVVLCVYFGLLIASRDRAYTKSKEEILSMIVEDARESGVRVSSKFWVLFLASMKGIGFLVTGGFVTATGVCVMHYLGMLSQRFQGFMEWHPGVIAASAVIAFVVSVVAYWILFRLLALYPYMESLRVISAMVMALAVNSMHYTGMYGASFYYDPTGEKSSSDCKLCVTSFTALTIALIVGVVGSWLILVFVIRDMRHWHRYCAIVIEKTDDIFAKAAKAPTTTASQLMSKYKEARGISFSQLEAGMATGSGYESKTAHKSEALPRKSFSNYNIRIKPTSTPLEPPKRSSKKTKDKIPTGVPKTRNSFNSCASSTTSSSSKLIRPIMSLNIDMNIE